MEEQRDESTLRPRGDQIPLWGEVASIRITIDTASDVPEGEAVRDDEYLYYELAKILDHRASVWDVGEYLERRHRVQTEIQDLTRRYLGPEYESRIDEVGPGSIIGFAVVITAVKVVFTTIKDYPDFVKGLILLQTHLQQLLNGILGDLAFSPVPLVVANTSLSLGPATYLADVLVSFRGGVNQLRNFLVYIAVATSLLVLGMFFVIYTLW